MHNRVITIDLLRHGATEGGAIYRGTTDSALSAEGAVQMGQTVNEFSLASAWQKVFSSPLQRCSGFAQNYATAGNVPLVLDQNLIEIDFGDWEGRDVSAVWCDFPQQAEAFWRNPEDNPPPGGETIAELQSRVSGFLDRVLVPLEVLTIQGRPLGRIDEDMGVRRVTLSGLHAQRELDTCVTSGTQTDVGSGAPEGITCLVSGSRQPRMYNWCVFMVAVQASPVISTGAPSP